MKLLFVLFACAVLWAVSFSTALQRTYPPPPQLLVVTLNHVERPPAQILGRLLQITNNGSFLFAGRSYPRQVLGNRTRVQRQAQQRADFLAVLEILAPRNDTSLLLKEDDFVLCVDVAWIEAALLPLVPHGAVVNLAYGAGFLYVPRGAVAALKSELRTCKLPVDTCLNRVASVRFVYPLAVHRHAGASLIGNQHACYVKCFVACWDAGNDAATELNNSAALRHLYPQLPTPMLKENGRPRYACNHDGYQPPREFCV